MYLHLLLRRGSCAREKDANTNNREYRKDDEDTDKHIRAFVRIEYAVCKIEYLVEYPRIPRLPIFFCHMEIQYQTYRMLHSVLHIL